MTRRRASLPLCCALALSPILATVGAAEPAPPPIRLSLVGTNDVHGHLLPAGEEGGATVFAGYLANLRAARTRDGGGVLLLDAGDMLQGTLESNRAEGAPMIALMNALRYDAAAVGNHEFDFGPEGPAATPQRPGDDPRGALEHRAREAHFPLLAANLVVAAAGGPPSWPNVHASAILRVAGLVVGVIGVTTEETLTTTMPRNVSDLAVRPLAPAIAREAQALRAKGADLVLVAAHAGGRCLRFENEHDASSCEVDSEIARLTADLPAGSVDAIVAGHSHAGIAHWLHGIPVIESFAYGREFGRIDFTFDRATRRLLQRSIQAPREICARVVEGTERCDDDAIHPGVRWLPARYEGAAVLPDVAIARLIAPAVADAKAQREAPVGVTLAAPIRRSSHEESALGNLLVDLLLRGTPGADVAMLNGGGIRQDLPDGPLTYGALYETYPFDNHPAVLSVPARELARAVAVNLQRNNGILSLSGLTARAACARGQLRVELRRPDGRTVTDDEPLRLVTSDFLIAGGDAVLAASATAPGNVTLGDETLRDVLARELARRQGAIEPRGSFDPASPRLVFPGARPVRCPSP